MLRRMISLDCGVRQLAQVREAVGSIPGVVAAESVVGKSAIRIWCGDEMNENVLTAAVRRCGVQKMSIH